MSDSASSPVRKPLDQADGLRRMFAGQGVRVLPLVANACVPHTALILDHVALVLAGLGRKVLLVDAAASAPQAPELAQVDLAACVETVSASVYYLPARGLPLRYVDARGDAGAFVDALFLACPGAETIVLNAEASDLARVLKNRAARPVLLVGDDLDSLKQAYAGCKILATRCGLMTFDLLLGAAAASPRLGAIANSLAGCAEQFMGAALLNHALIDPSRVAGQGVDRALLHLLRSQLSMDMNIQTRGPQARNPDVSAASSRSGVGTGAARPWAHATSWARQNTTAY